MSNKINEQITVSAQIKVEDVPEIAAQGFVVMMSNRPDGEERGQPATADLQAAAEAAGMRFLHIPIHSGQFTPEAVGEFGDIVDTGDKIFAYCRTGTRSAALWALSQAGNLPADEILEATANAGYDFSQLAPMLRRS